MKTTIAGALAALCLTIPAFGQQFINLDFEQAIVQPIDPDGIDLEWEKAVPGWSHSEGSDTENVFHNTTHLGITQAYTLLASPTPPDWPVPLEGNFSLLFRNGAYSPVGGGPGWVHAFVAQSGLVPADALSIRLKAEGPLSVFLDDVELPVVSLGGNDYSGDISTYAGTVSELRIQNSATSPIQQPNSLIIDAIQFSPEPIPEPAGVVLLLTGGLLLWAKRNLTGLVSRRS